MYPMLDKESLPKQIRERWINWANQVPLFGFNSRKHDMNLIKEYFMKNLSSMNDVTVMEKDNSYMFLMTPRFKFWMLRIILLQVLARMAGARQMDA